MENSVVEGAVVTGGITSEQTTALNDGLTSMSGNVMTTFVSLLPAVGAIVAVGFAIGFVKSQINKLRRNR